MAIFAMKQWKMAEHRKWTPTLSMAGVCSC
jgi:hypothetical protein